MRGFAIAIALFAVACSTAHPLDGRVPYAQTWLTVGPRLQSACGGCHGDQAQGGYRIGSYLDAIGATSGTRVAIAGDATSTLVVILDPSTATAPHDGQAELAAAVRTWVVDDALAYATSDVHAAGLLDPLSTDFHGQLVRDRGWNLSFCARCHGADFGGGSAGASCNGCHVGTPTGCSTCHATPPASGAHLAHANGPRLGRKLDCGECHVKPAAWDAPGHIYDEHGVRLPSPAVVTFGALASTSTPTRSATPTWSGATCDNVYCHGAAFDDSSAQHTRPGWSDGPSATMCGTCHGLPPAGHPGGACSTCHGAVVDDDFHLVQPSAHIVGRVSLGADGSGGCTSCHPNPGGAHVAHTQATHEIAAPIACTECHVVPTSVDAAGHLSASGDAAVFPSGGVGSVASAGGAAPAFDGATATCADVHCHGGGDALAADQALGLRRTPSWSADADAIGCGSCHGVPPIDGLHDVHWTLTTCASCHPKTIDRSGAIRGGAGSTHINGAVDVQ